MSCIDITLSTRNILQSELYYYSKMSQVKMNAELTTTELKLTPIHEPKKSASAGRMVVVTMTNLLGAEFERGGYFRVFECRQHAKKRKRMLIEHTFRIQDEELAQQWCKVLRYLASPFATDACPSIPEMLENQPIPRRFLVLINPVGGSGKATKVFTKSVAPIFKRCGIEYEEILTNRAHHATEIAKEVDLVKIDGIVAVGGDGFLSEVVQGLMAREDWAEAIRMPLGIIPAGSGNGLANSLAAAANEVCDPVGSAFIVAKGMPRGLDIASVRSAQEKFYSFLSFEWALIANIDIESEQFRCLGGARFTFSAIKRILCSRQKWQGKFSFLPEDGETPPPEYSSTKIDTGGESHLRPSMDLLPSLSGPIPDTWKTIEGYFGIFWAISPSHAAGDAIVYPDAKYDDGYMYCMFAEGNLSMSDMISILLKLEDGSYLSHKKISVVRTRAFQLESANGCDLMAVDGELWNTATTQVQLHRQLGQIISLA